MERLTTQEKFPHGKKGRIYKEAVKSTEVHRGCFEATAIVERLSEYEDTDLTPDEVMKLKEENSALKTQLENTVNNTCAGCRFVQTDSHKYYTFPCKECRRRTKDYFEEAERIETGGNYD